MNTFLNRLIINKDLRVKAVAFFAAVSILFFPVVGFALINSSAPNSAEKLCTTSTGEPGICNPLGFTSLVTLIETVINVILTIGIPIIALLIMYVGLKFVTARGDEKQISAAKDMLKWTLIGTAIILGASGILRLLQGTINQVISTK